MSWPFDRWLRIAVRQFGMPPRAFWEMPVRDWLILIQAERRPGLDRVGLTELMTQHPDIGDENDT